MKVAVSIASSFALIVGALVLIALGFMLRKGEKVPLSYSLTIGLPALILGGIAGQVWTYGTKATLYVLLAILALFQVGDIYTSARFQNGHRDEANPLARFLWKSVGLWSMAALKTLVMGLGFWLAYHARTPRQIMHVQAALITLCVIYSVVLFLNSFYVYLPFFQKLTERLSQRGS